MSQNKKIDSLLAILSLAFVVVKLNQKKPLKTLKHGRKWI